METGPDCPKYTECANADLKCFLCKNLSLFKPGKNTGKGSHHERKIKKVRETTAHLRKGSGNVAHAKGDLIDDACLHEGKSGYTRVNSKGQTIFSLKKAWLIKIEREALVEGRLPVLEIHFDGDPQDHIYSVVPSGVLFDLIEDNKKLEALLKEKSHSKT